MGSIYRSAFQPRGRRKEKMKKLVFRVNIYYFKIILESDGLMLQFIMFFLRRNSNNVRTCRFRKTIPTI